jgi:hypothetical protein
MTSSGVVSAGQMSVLGWHEGGVQRTGLQELEARCLNGSGSALDSLALDDVVLGIWLLFLGTRGGGALWLG